MKYNNMHLADLRRHARAIGVKSPTTHNKKELIEKIVKIESGLEEPYFSKMGRPVLGNDKDLAEMLIDGNNKVKNALHVDVLLSIVRKSITYLIEMEDALSKLKQKE